MLGAGFVGRRHVDRLVTLPGVEVVGGADPQRERAEALAESCGAQVVEGVRGLVDLGLDGLYVGVPPHQHGEPEDVAIEAGVPVFLEKPLANDLSTAEDIGERVAKPRLGRERALAREKLEDLPPPRAQDLADGLTPVDDLPCHSRRRGCRTRSLRVIT